MTSSLPGICKEAARAGIEDDCGHASLSARREQRLDHRAAGARRAWPRTGLLAGANVMMPNVTDTEYRQSYRLYENKPCLDKNSAKCRTASNGRILSIGETINWGIAEIRRIAEERLTSMSR